MEDSNLIDLDDTVRFRIRCGISARGEPIVDLLHGEEGDEVIFARMSPQEARDLAREITEAATGIEQDGLLLAFARDRTGCDLSTALGMLIAFRGEQQCAEKVPAAGLDTPSIDRTPLRHARRQRSTSRRNSSRPRA